MGARREAVFFSPYLGPLLAARAGRPGAGSTGGAETQVLLIAGALAARGRRVAIATFDLPAGLPDRVEGIEVIRLPARPTGAGRLAAVAWRARLLTAMVAKLDGETLVQRAAGAATALVAALARLRRRRFVYSSANVIDFAFDRLETDAKTVRRFRSGVRMADAVVVQSEEQAELCERAFGRRGHVIWSIAEPAAARTAEPEAFLWIGRLAPYKRPLALLDLAEHLPHARFAMVGTESPLDPGLAETVAARASALPNVVLYDPRPRHELEKLIERAVAIVNTSDYEGMPNVFLEGWARGVPALALSHDPDGVIAGERLGWFADGDVSRLAAVAQEAWEGRGEQQELAGRCRGYVARRHGAAAVASAWEAVLWPSGAAEEASEHARGGSGDPEPTGELGVR